MSLTFFCKKAAFNIFLQLIDIYLKYPKLFNVLNIKLVFCKAK